MSVGDYLVKAYLRPVACALPIIILGYAALHVEAASWLMFGAEAMILCGVFGVAAYFVCLDQTERSSVTGRLAAVFQREVIIRET